MGVCAEIELEINGAEYQTLYAFGASKFQGVPESLRRFNLRQD